METIFKLVQVSRPKSVKLEAIDSDLICFEAKVEMDQDRFDALFKYCENNWDDVKFAKIQHDGLYPCGEPKNPVFTGIYHS